MISRTWHGAVPVAHRNGFAEYLQLTGVKEAKEIAGNRGAYVNVVDQGGYSHFFLCTFWDSWEDVILYAGDEAHKAITYPEDEKFGLISDPIVIHQIVTASDNPFVVTAQGKN